MTPTQQALAALLIPIVVAVVPPLLGAIPGLSRAARLRKALGSDIAVLKDLPADSVVRAALQAAIERNAAELAALGLVRRSVGLQIVAVLALAASIGAIYLSEAEALTPLDTAFLSVSGYVLYFVGFLLLLWTQLHLSQRRGRQVRAILAGRPSGRKIIYSDRMWTRDSIDAHIIPPSMRAANQGRLWRLVRRRTIDFLRGPRRDSRIDEPPTH